MTIKLTLMLGVIAVLTASSCLSRRSSTTVTTPLSISTTMTAAAGSVQLENATSRTLQIWLDKKSCVLAPGAKTTITGLPSAASGVPLRYEIYESGKPILSSSLVTGSSITIR